MTSSAPPQPCPIPRCSLEWALAAFLVVMGLMIGTLPAGTSSVLKALTVDHISPDICRFVAMGVLLSAGMFQGGALLIPGKAAQRWSAGYALVVLLVLSALLLGAQSMLVVAGVTVWGALCELFVFALLRGAKWASHNGLD